MSKNYIELKVSDLRDECKIRNLDSSGLKVHLIERLNKHDRDQSLKSKSEVKSHAVINEKPKSDIKNESINNKIDDKEISKSNVNNVFDGKQESQKNVSTTEKTTIKEDRKRPYQQESAAAKDDTSLVTQVETDNWESRTDVHLDFYNSDLNILIDENGYSASPMRGEGFEYMCGGVKANYGFKSGKIFYEVLILTKLKVDINTEAGDSNFIKVGWSTDNGCLNLGESHLSFAYEGLSKKSTEGIISEYGINFDEGSVVGCFLEFQSDKFIIKYSVNGVDQGVAFNILKRDLKDNVLIPHVYVRNMSFEVNFGQNNNRPIFSPKTTIDGQTKEDISWNLVGKVGLNQRIRTLKPPHKKSDCEVLMMCGLPSCGKTYWAEKQTKDNPKKRFNILSVNIILDKMKLINIRKKVTSNKWESFISSATNCLNKLIDIAVLRRRNIILDQTNVYPSAQRRRIKPFKGFIRKAIVIVPSDSEYEKRRKNVKNDNNKDAQDSAILQMKDNFIIPETNSDLFDEIVFIELQRLDAEELIRKYNNESKNVKTKDSVSDNKSKREIDNKSLTSYGQSVKESNNEASAAKKSRWSGHMDKKAESRNRDTYDHRSPDVSRRNDYKSSFGFSRDMPDFDRNDRSRESFRSEDRYNVKSFGGGDRYVGMPYHSNDMRPEFGYREDFRFGNRNAFDEGSRHVDARENFERDRLQGVGGYDSYPDERDIRGRFPQTHCNDRLGGGSVPDDLRGRGNQGYMAGKESFFGDHRNAQENRDYQNYSDFYSYSDVYRQNNKPWDPDFKDDYNDNFGRPFNYDNSKGLNRDQQLGFGYDQKYGRAAAPTSTNVTGSRGDNFLDRISTNPYSSDRKSVNKSSGQFVRGGPPSGPLTSNSRIDDYSFESNNNFESGRLGDRLPPKSGDTSPWGLYREKINAVARSDIPPYSGTQSFRSGFIKFDDKPKPVNSFEPKFTGSGSRELCGMSSESNVSGSFNNYSSFDNQNKSYSGNYSGSGNSGKKPPLMSLSTYPETSSNNRHGFSSSDYPSGSYAMGPVSGKSPGSSYSSGMQHKYMSSNLTSGILDHPSSNNNTTGPATGYQSFGNRCTNQLNSSSSYSSVPLSGISGGGYQGGSNPSSANTVYTNPYNAIYKNSGINYYGQTNSYAQSGSYGDSLKTTSYSSKPPVTNERVIQPLLSTATVPTSRSLSLASWGTGQYYGQN